MKSDILFSRVCNLQFPGVFFFFFFLQECFQGQREGESEGKLRQGAFSRCQTNSFSGLSDQSDA